MLNNFGWTRAIHAASCDNTLHIWDVETSKALFPAYSFTSPFSPFQTGWELAASASASGSQLASSFSTSSPLHRSPLNSPVSSRTNSTPQQAPSTISHNTPPKSAENAFSTAPGSPPGPAPQPISNQGCFPHPFSPQPQQGMAPPVHLPK